MTHSIVRKFRLREIQPCSRMPRDGLEIVVRDEDGQLGMIVRLGDEGIVHEIDVGVGHDVAEVLVDATRTPSLRRLLNRVSKSTQRRSKCSGSSLRKKSSTVTRISKAG